MTSSDLKTDVRLAAGNLRDEYHAVFDASIATTLNTFQQRMVLNAVYYVNAYYSSLLEAVASNVKFKCVH